MPTAEPGGTGWRGTEYAAQAVHHRIHDDWFIAQHPPQPDDVVVDAGCGTGEFTVQLAALVPDGRVIGVEPDASMLEQARGNAGPNIEFRAGRLQDLDTICPPGSADLVVSRAVFHWIAISEYPRCYDAVHDVLRPGGWFHAESGATGNVRHVVELMDDIATAQGLERSRAFFPDSGTVLELLEQAGFVCGDAGVAAVAQRRRFDRAQLVGFLRTQAAMAYVSGATPAVRDAFLAAVEARVDELRRLDGTYDQTFVRLHVLCQRRS
jgi:trans-aconitate methyltransferase